MVVKKYGSRRRDSSAEFGNIRRYSSPDMWKQEDGCTEIWKHGEGCLYINIEA
jgi:hypothetical protein